MAGSRNNPQALAGAACGQGPLKGADTAQGGMLFMGEVPLIGPRGSRIIKRRLEQHVLGCPPHWQDKTDEAQTVSVHNYWISCAFQTG